MCTMVDIAIDEAAYIAVVEPVTVIDWIEFEELPGSRCGRLWRITRAELEAFVREAPDVPLLCFTDDLRRQFLLFMMAGLLDAREASRALVRRIAKTTGRRLAEASSLRRSIVTCDLKASALLPTLVSVMLAIDDPGESPETGLIVLGRDPACDRDTIDGVKRASGDGGTVDGVAGRGAPTGTLSGR